MDKGLNLAAFVGVTRRRQWLLGAAFATGGLLARPAAALAAGEDELSHAAEAIHQEVNFKASPQRLYEVLLDAAQFQKVEMLSDVGKSLDITGKPAQIHREAGGVFSIFADYIVGRQIELVPNQRIVQAWRVQSWNPGIYSIAKFELMPQGSGTKLVFDHTGFPVGAGAHLTEGWKSHYWEPLEKYFG